MPRRVVVFLALALLAATGFVRLGFWQLERRADRRTRNADLAARLAVPPVALLSLARDSSSAFRRVDAAGELDFEHEFVWSARTRNGSPGVHLLTPLRLAGSDSAVLVDRGWLYAPDGVVVDLKAHREAETRFSGYLTPLASTAGRVSVSRQPRTVHALNVDTLAAMLPYPVLRVLLMATDSSTEGGPGAPVRVEPPRLDDGSHLSYAIQWFTFALISLVGAAIVARRAQRR